MVERYWAIVLKNNLTHIICRNKTLLDCKNEYHTIPKELLDPYEKDVLDFPFLADKWPVLMLSIIALFCNVSELVCLKLRKLKNTKSEYFIISLCFLDLAYSLLTITAITVKLIEEKARIYESEEIIIITKQFQWFSIFGSIFHVLAISLERVFAVTYLMEYRVLMEKANMLVCVLTLWILTLVLQGSISIFQYHKGIEYGLEKASRTADQATGGIIFFVGFLICILNITMVYKILKQAILLRGFSERKNRRASIASRKRSGVETLAFITCCLVSFGFLIFNFPYAAMLIFFKEASLKFEITAECLLITNSIFNPIIYFWRGYWLRTNRRKSVKRSLSYSQSTEAIFHLNNTPFNYRRSQETITLASTNNNSTL
ncbi:galanin receptor type 1-like [Hydractinia symbiolongicarpus]|uniref:galanin receptor type 1-like n=1 Tax=Hydractinia symbiolongicarpus TaxID=13093 RepID=UPI00254FDC95|nr:galanin receptor type 1-like [Hydractinia symbiolongicarpus]